MKCTAEDLVARKDGGHNRSSNIAAVYFLCNQRRHKRKVPLSPDAYRAWVQQKLMVFAVFITTSQLQRLTGW
jgi:hypothetical protein